MARIKNVEIQTVSIDRLQPLLPAGRIERLRALAEDARKFLAGRKIININSTASGGGVAEMMQVLLAYVGGANIDIRWLVIECTPEFFAITKRLHNAIHGSAGDGGALGAAEKIIYEQVLKENGEELRSHITPGDIVILHDPQTAGLTDQIRSLGATVLWRCHIGSDLPSSIGMHAWEFLRPYVEAADSFIFTRSQYAPEWADHSRAVIIQPSIDPFSAKNMDLSDAQCISILCSAGILENDSVGVTPSFTRDDGSTGIITHEAKVYRTGPPPSARARLVVQVSRWDRLKDMLGVMKGFAAHVDYAEDVHLMLVGPAVDGVTDDPEGEAVLNECLDFWKRLASPSRSRIHLVLLPMEDRVENAIMVNAIQRHATIVVQKSVAEGFGLTVTEPMWKARPVVASKIGGIPDQIVHEEHGLLINDPNDLKGFGDAVNRLLKDRELADRLGKNARSRVIKEFLADRHLEQYAELIMRL